MRQHHLKLTCLLIGCMVTLVACTQTASVGIATPDQAASTARSVFATSAAAQPTTAPVPAATVTPAPTQAVMPTTAPTVAPIVVPTPTTTEQAQPAPTAQSVAPADTGASNSSVGCNRTIYYTIKPGDNLFRIALKYRTTINAIARRNNIYDARVIRSGQRLRILTCARW